MTDKLRAAAQAALEELIASESNAWNVINDLEAALAEPEQEPMPPEIIKMYEDYFDKCFREAQRPWVGLTDDEIEHLRNDQPWWMVRDIEAKLREKNTMTEDDDLNNMRYKAKYRYETKQPLTEEEIDKAWQKYCEEMMPQKTAHVDPLAGAMYKTFVTGWNAALKEKK